MASKTKKETAIEAATNQASNAVQWRIETPAKYGRVKRCGVDFVDGVAITTDAMTAQLCRTQGYKVEEVQPAE